MSQPRRRTNDDKLYHRATLANGIQLLLVLPGEQATTERDGDDDDEANELQNVAGMCVWAGSAHDPVSTPGLAHLLEHMLFFGTEDHPDNDWKALVKSAGGITNASTSHERTCFYFSSSSPSQSDSSTSSSSSSSSSEPARELDSFWKLLEVWSSFFICPLFRLSDQESARKAVDSEFRRNKQNDFRRERQVFRTLAHPRSLFHRFATGNLETLRNNYTPPSSSSSSTSSLSSDDRSNDSKPDRDEHEDTDLTRVLQEFHKKWYVAENMTLCLYLSKQCTQSFGSLSAMVDHIEHLFSRVHQHQQHSSDTIITDIPPAFKAEPARLVRILSVKKQHVISYVWPVLPCFDRQQQVLDYRNKTTAFLAHTLGYEGRGSLLAALKRLGWATGLSAGLSDSSVDMTSFHVSVTLATPGLGRVDDIAEMVFAYLCLLLRSEGALCARYSEFAALRDIRFGYGEAHRPWLLVKQLSIAMHAPYTPEQLLTGEYLVFSGFEEARDDVRRWLQLLCSTVGLLVFFNSSSAHDPDRLGETEHFYGTRWSHEPASERLCQVAQHCHRYLQSSTTDDDGNEGEMFAVVFDQKLELPPLNCYVPDSFDTFVDGNDDDDADDADDAETTTTAVPVLQTSGSPSGMLSVWYQPDVQFRRPKTFIRLALNSTEMSSPRSVVLAKLFTRLVRSALNEVVYDAEAAGYSLSIKPKSQGVHVSLHGFTSKMPVLLQAVLHGLAGVHVDLAPVFEMERERLANSWASIPLQTPAALVGRYRHLAKSAWLHDTALPRYQEELQRVTLSDVVEWARRALFGSETGAVGADGGGLTCSTLYVYGGDARGAAVYANMIASALSMPAALQPEHHLAYKQWCDSFVVCVLPPNSSAVCTLTSDDPRQTNCACLVEFYVGIDHDNNNNFNNDDNDDNNEAALLLFEQIVAQQVFDQLRTIKHLGYIARGSAEHHHGLLYYQIVVQSQVASPLAIDEAIDETTRSFEPLLTGMTDQAFQAHKTSLTSKLLQRCHRSDALVDRNWHDLLMRRTTFDRRARTAAALAAVSRERLLALWQSCIDVSSQRRRFSVHFWSEDRVRFPRPVPLLGVTAELLEAWRQEQTTHLHPNQ